jgi:hypothetical protein
VLEIGETAMKDTRRVEGVSAITVMIFIINPKSMLDIVAGAFR